MIGPWPFVQKRDRLLDEILRRAVHQPNGKVVGAYGRHGSHSRYYVLQSTGTSCNLFKVIVGLICFYFQQNICF